MSIQKEDINLEIDRILSSNIRDQLLCSLPLQLLQSPIVQKSNKRQIENSSCSSKRSLQRRQFEEDLYQKAEQIFKLKQILQSQLSNINQIVQDNQKLTEANLCLKSELKKIKNEWKQFRIQVLNNLNQKQKQIKSFQIQQMKELKRIVQKSRNFRDKMKICQVDQLNNVFYECNLKVKNKRSNLCMTNDIVKQCISFPKQQLISSMKQFQCQTQFTFQNLQELQILKKDLTQIKLQVLVLNEENSLLKQKIQCLTLSTKNKSHLQSKSLTQKPLNQQQSIQCYSSVFMKSVIEQQQNYDQTVIAKLFKPQKSIFQQLQQSKYFGKIVMRNKNGNAIQQYKNGFQYQGNFCKNNRHGIGKLFYKHKLVYAGQWKQGKFQGKGLLFYYLNLNVQKIQANFKNGYLQGNGTISFKSGHKLRGQFKNNKLLSDGMLLLNQNTNSLFLQKKSYIGSIQLSTNKQNIVNKDKIIFKTKQGQLIEI